MRYHHFACCSKTVFAVRFDDAEKPVAPTCRTCDRPMKRRGTRLGAKRLRPRAVEIGSLYLSRNTPEARQRSQKRADAIRTHRLASIKALEKVLGPDTDPDPQDDEDGADEYLPRADSFNIRARCTAHPYNAPAVRAVADSTFFKTSSWKRVAATHGRSALNVVMQLATGSRKPLPAWKHHGTTRYKTDRYTSSEWCHLVADSLGGSSFSSNLVAASFCANTYMAAIEIVLKGRTDCEVNISAECAEDHAAETIIYRIRKGTRTHEEWIFARATGFNGNDFDTVQARITGFVGKG